MGGGGLGSRGHLGGQAVNETIREIPDHATFRGKGVNTGQTWGMSLFGSM